MDKPLPKTQTCADVGPWCEEWLRICLQNGSIVNQHEPTEIGAPIMSGSSFKVYTSAYEMAREMVAGNWNTGAAFVYKDQCWVNQVLAGCEMLVMKQDVSFESVTADSVAGIGYHYPEDGDPYCEREPVHIHLLVDMIYAIDQATVAECAGMDYGKYERFDHDTGDLKKCEVAVFVDGGTVVETVPVGPVTVHILDSIKRDCGVWDADDEELYQRFQDIIKRRTAKRLKELAKS